MRKLTFLVIFLAVLYGGYWLVGARAVENGARDALAQLQADGWMVSYRDLETVGFPSRFDTTVTDLALTSADGQARWISPFVQVFALSYQPNRIIAALPPAFTIGFKDDDYQVSNDRLRLSAGVKTRRDLALNDVTIAVDGIAVTSPGFGRLTLDQGLGALRAAATGENKYDIYVETDTLARITPPPRGALPDKIDHIMMDGTITLDHPLNLAVVDGTGPQPALRGLDLRDLRIDLDGISMTASGQLAWDALGVPDGRITFRTAQWRETITLLIAAGLIDAGMQDTIINIVGAFAVDNGIIALPLLFQNGFMSVGPVPLGPAPRLR